MRRIDVGILVQVDVGLRRAAQDARGLVENERLAGQGAGPHPQPGIAAQPLDQRHEDADRQPDGELADEARRRAAGEQRRAEEPIDRVEEHPAERAAERTADQRVAELGAGRAKSN